MIKSESNMCINIISHTEQVVKDALSLGINFFDTANGYSAGTSEEYLGHALKKNMARHQVVIASKVYFNPGRLSSEAIHRKLFTESSQKN